MTSDVGSAAPRLCVFTTLIGHYELLNEQPALGPPTFARLGALLADDRHYSQDVVLQPKSHRR
jgi:hypothetical protein